MANKKKQSVYLPEEMLQEIKDEAKRINRSFSWTLHKAWQISRTKIKDIPKS